MARKSRPVAERFWEMVQRAEGDACWEWRGGRSWSGYGLLTVGRTTKFAHRLSWELHFGPIPEGEGHHGTVVRHLVCDNPPCVNPAHLALGTQADNMEDRRRKGRCRKLSPDEVKGRRPDVIFFPAPSDVLACLDAAPRRRDVAIGALRARRDLREALGPEWWEVERRAKVEGVSVGTILGRLALAQLQGKPAKK